MTIVTKKAVFGLAREAGRREARPAIAVVNAAAALNLGNL
jgi:hypothetical protein